MSTSLFWEPPPKEIKRHYIDLKYQVGKYFDEDYNGGNGSWTVGKEFIDFLRGVIAVGNENHRKDAIELIAAIEKYGEVVLTIA